MEGKVEVREEDATPDIFWPTVADDPAINGGLLPTEDSILSPLLLRRQSQLPMSLDSSYLHGRILYDLKKTNPFESPAKGVEELFMHLSDTAPTGFFRPSHFHSRPGSSSPWTRNVLTHERDESSEKIDRLLQKKALPEKGKLLQAVIEAGPLLETLLVAGYLPKWRHPPPLLPFQVPSVSLRPPAVISSLGRHSRHAEALQLLRRLLSLGLRPNQFTFGTAIHSSTVLAITDLGKQLHAQAAKVGLQCNVFVGSSLVNFYGKLGTVEEASSAFSEVISPNVFSYTSLLSCFLRNKNVLTARRLFDEMPGRNSISWNAMISGLCKSGENEEALELFVEMRREGMMSSGSTFSAVISAAGNVAALRLGEALHASAAKFISEQDAFLASSLISFYSKCGLPDSALRVFSNQGFKTLVLWNALISGLALNGRGRETLEMHEMMIREGFKGNDVTLLGLLSACSHSGMVEEGCEIFRRARLEAPEMLRAEHYGCAADMLARRGKFAEARRLVEEVPASLGLGFWKTMAGGSVVEKAESRWAEAVAEGMEEEGLGEDEGAYVMLSNAYSAIGMWDRVAQVRETMKDRGMDKNPGCSWIEVEGHVKVFFNGDWGDVLVAEVCHLPHRCLCGL